MKTVYESILSSTNSGVNFHKDMECLAYSNHPKAIELRKEFSVENSATPEGFIFTDNGCTDLERKGIKGVYLWVGYKHSKARWLSKKLPNFVYTVAQKMQQIFGKPVIIEDVTTSADMYRLYIEM